MTIRSLKNEIKCFILDKYWDLINKKIVYLNKTRYFSIIKFKLEKKEQNNKLYSENLIEKLVTVFVFLLDID